MRQMKITVTYNFVQSNLILAVDERLPWDTMTPLIHFTPSNLSKEEQYASPNKS